MTDWFGADLRSALVSVALAAGQAGLRIAAAVVAGYLGMRVLRAAIGRVEAVLVAAGQRTESAAEATRKRVATLTGVLRTLVLVAVWAVVAMVCLSQLGFDVTPIVAGAGTPGRRCRDAPSLIDNGNEPRLLCGTFAGSHGLTAASSRTARHRGGRTQRCHESTHPQGAVS